MSLHHADIDRPIRVMEVPAETNVVKNIDELLDYVRNHLVKHLIEADAVAIPCGVINREVFKWNGGFVPEDQIPTALFHAHKAVLLVPSQPQGTNTILASPKSVGEATLNAMTMPQWREPLLNSRRKVQRIFNEIEDYLRCGLNGQSKRASKHHAHLNPRQCILHAAKRLKHILLENLLSQEQTFAFVAGIQQASTPVTLDWQRYDIGCIGENVLHCRDIRSRPQRLPGELLRVIPVLPN